MTKLEINIMSIKEELEQPINRETFLAENALHKIKIRSLNYDKELNKYIEILDNSDGSAKDLPHLTSTISSLSSLISRSYDDLITMISKCERNIFKNKD